MNDGNLRKMVVVLSGLFLIHLELRTRRRYNLEENSNIGHGTAASEGYRITDV